MKTLRSFLVAASLFVLAASATGCREADAATTSPGALALSKITAIAFMTNEIDFTTTGSYLFNNSKQPGKRFVLTAFANNSKILYTATAGTISVQASGSIGTNSAAFDNYAPISAISDSTTFALGPGAFTSTMGFNIRPVSQDLGGGIFVKVTTPSSGTGLTMKGKIVMFGGLVPM